MNKIELLKKRKAEVLSVGAEIRAKIAALVDENSFAEFDSFSFSKNEFYSEAGGEGLITGSAALNDNSVFVIAQNSAVLSGGLTKANCEKIVKCQEKAARSGSPIIYLLDSRGVAVGEGVNVLEGIAEVLATLQSLKGEVPQFAVCLGEVYGSSALIAAGCDYTFVLEGACVAHSSPLVLCAKGGKNVDKEVLGGVKSAKHNGLATFVSHDMVEVRDTVAKLLDLLPDYNGEVETMDDYNRTSPELNEKACEKCIIDAVFDKDYFIEFKKDFAPAVKVGAGRVGGIACGAIVFAGEEEGVALDNDVVSKIKEFVYYCDENSLPLLTFVNARGIKECECVAKTEILKSVANLTYALNNLQTPRINVVYKNAIGLGYSLFGSKALGADYSYAFATAKISLFETEKGAMIEFAGVNEKNHDAAAQKYAEEVQDPFNAAKNGFIDDIIEPEFVRQYVIAALQRLV